MKKLIKLELVLIIGLLTNIEIYGSIVSINTGGIDEGKEKIEKKRIEKRDHKLAKVKITIPSYSSIRCIYEDGNRHIWIGTDGDGLLKFDGKKFQKFTMKEGLSANHVRSIIQDNVGNFWISTIEGLDIYNGMFFKNVLSNKSTGFKYANCSFKDKNGTLWFGANDGVYKINNFNIEYISIANEAGDKKTNRAYSVHSIVQDKKGIFWFGTEHNGICKYDGKQISFIREKSIDEGTIRSIIIDKQGLMWFGNSTGLYTYNGKVLINITQNIKAKELTKVWSIKEDAMGKIWVGTFDHGIWTIEGSTIKNLHKNEGLSTDGIRTIYIDKKNKMWFGGENGAMFEFKRNLFEEVFLRDNC